MNKYLDLTIAFLLISYNSYSSLYISIFNLITGDISHKLISSAVVLLFSIYILYDTNIILQRNYAGDFISASISYYLDIINVFNSLNVLNSD